MLEIETTEISNECKYTYKLKGINACSSTKSFKNSTSQSSHFTSTIQVTTIIDHCKKKKKVRENKNREQDGVRNPPNNQNK